MSQKCEEKSTMFASPTEEYTSKTCENCGMLNRKLGSSRTFRMTKQALDKQEGELLYDNVPKKGGGAILNVLGNKFGAGVFVINHSPMLLASVKIFNDDG